MTDDTILQNLTLIEDRLWVVTRPTGMAQYDFRFEDFFACHHPIHRGGRIRAVARLGAPEDYDQRYRAFSAEGIDLIHTPSEYLLTSHLPNWYPLISDLTPRSQWFDHRPTVAEIESAFAWPVFIKGERQTSRHQRYLSIIESRHQFEQVMDLWQADPILRWQRIVVREFLPLRLVGMQSPTTLPKAFEFRTFWWNQRCVGFGPYWIGDHYTCTANEKSSAIALAGEAARRLGATFVVADVAQTQKGNWTVIEVNDGQDSGYAGVQPLMMWRGVLEELNRKGG